MNLKNITADKLVALYKNKDVSVTEVINSTYEEVDRIDKNIRAFISLSPERALEEARRIDAKIAAGEPLEPLAGVPVAIKDNMTIRDTPTTCGSRILENYIPPYTATAVERLRGAGAIVIGKTNMDEFAMGSSNETSSYGPVISPWRRKDGGNAPLAPGGSSGGSSAAVAASALPIFSRDLANRK